MTELRTLKTNLYHLRQYKKGLDKTSSKHFNKGDYEGINKEIEKIKKRLLEFKK